MDNTRNSRAYFDTICQYGSASALHFDPLDRWVETLLASWQLIYKFATEHGFRWVLSLEQDVIIPPNALSLMVDYADEHNLCLLVHDYPARPSTGLTGKLEELGCTLIDVQDLDWALKAALAATVPVNLVGLLRSITAPAMARVHLFETEHLDGDVEGKWGFSDPDCRLLPAGANPATFARGEWR